MYSSHNFIGVYIMNGAKNPEGWVKGKKKEATQTDSPHFCENSNLLHN